LFLCIFEYFTGNLSSKEYAERFKLIVGGIIYVDRFPTFIH
jgi:hypothetical protein